MDHRGYKFDTQERKPRSKVKKVDRSRQKERKHKKKKFPVDMRDFEDEMLAIQGLIKCKECEGSYPIALDACPCCDRRD